MKKSTKNKIDSRYDFDNDREFYFDKKTNQPYSGHFIIYWKNGKKREEGMIIDGHIKNGIWTQWNPGGGKSKEINYKNGEVHGQYTFWVNGIVLTKKNYKYGLLHGKSTENLQLTVDRVVKNKEGNYKNGKKEGIWKYYSYKGHVLLETNYINGERNGLSNVWWSKGIKKEEGNYKNDKVDGLWTDWYENGKKKWEHTWKDGKFDGLWTEWYENGQKKEERTYKDMKEDGLRTNWWDNGQKKEERTVKDGKFDGLWTGWNENGQKFVEKTYKDGKLISENYW